MGMGGSNNLLIAELGGRANIYKRTGKSIFGVPVLEHDVVSSTVGSLAIRQRERIPHEFVREKPTSPYCNVFDMELVKLQKAESISMEIPTYDYTRGDVHDQPHIDDKPCAFTTVYSTFSSYAGFTMIDGDLYLVSAPAIGFVYDEEEKGSFLFNPDWQKDPSIISGSIPRINFLIRRVDVRTPNFDKEKIIGELFKKEIGLEV